MVDDSLLEVLRSGARRMLQQVIEAEVEAFLAAHADLEDAPSPHWSGVATRCWTPPMRPAFDTSMPHARTAWPSSSSARG